MFICIYFKMFIIGILRVRYFVEKYSGFNGYIYVLFNLI